MVSVTCLWKRGTFPSLRWLLSCSSAVAGYVETQGRNKHKVIWTKMLNACVSRRVAEQNSSFMACCVGDQAGGKRMGRISVGFPSSRHVLSWDGGNQGKSRRQAELFTWMQQVLEQRTPGEEQVLLSGFSWDWGVHPPFRRWGRGMSPVWPH